MGPARRLGVLSSLGLAAVGFAYLVVVTLAIADVGLEDPIVDPTLAVMESLTLVAALLLVVMMAALYAAAPAARKVYALLALAFAVIMAALTSTVHFVLLTAGRQSGSVVLEWPSTAYAVELLAWNLFLGLSLLSAAAVFRGPSLLGTTRWVLMITGALCVLGTLGPALGDLALQRIGIVGYGVGLPLASLFLAAVFRRRVIDPEAA